VAIAEEPSVDPKAARRRERLALEVPAGMSAEGLGLERYAMRAVMPMVTNYLFERTARAPLTDLRVVGTVIRVDPDGVLLEFEVPLDGYTIEPAGWRLVISGRFRTRRVELRLVPEESSAAGPHSANTLVRVRLRSLSGKGLPSLTDKSWLEFHGSCGPIRLRLEIQFDTHA
jgi:hypothetical protein